MIDPAKLALIDAEIDGQLDDRQRAELSRCLLTDPALRAAREQMRRLSLALEAVEEVEPPKQLRADILAALPQIYPPRAGIARPTLRWRYAAVLAGLLLTGTLVFRAMDFGQQEATNDMAGTLAGTRAASTMDMVQLSSRAVTGRVSLIRDVEGLSLTFDLAARAPVDVLVSAGGHSLRVNGLGAQGSHGGGTTTIALVGFGGDVQAVNLTFLIGSREVARAALRDTTGH
jgi:anti-sigma factor RsiW